MPYPLAPLVSEHHDHRDSPSHANRLSYHTATSLSRSQLARATSTTRVSLENQSSRGSLAPRAAAADTNCAELVSPRDCITHRREIRDRKSSRDGCSPSTGLYYIREEVAARGMHGSALCLADAIVRVLLLEDLRELRGVVGAIVFYRAFIADFLSRFGSLVCLVRVRVPAFKMNCTVEQNSGF